MIGTLITRLVAVGGAVCALALAGVAQADAASWPFHGGASASCVSHYGRHFIQGTMPAVGPRDEALGTIDLSDTGGGSQAADEWIFYRLAVGYNDSSGQLHWDRSNWDAVLNRYQGGGMIWEVLNGAWQQVNIGGYYGGTTDPGTVLEVPEDGDYAVYSEYWWSPIPGFGWLGPLYEYIGSVHCSTD